MKDSQPAKKKTGVTRKLLSYLKGSKYIILAALVMAVIGAVLTIIGPNQIGKITDFMSAGLMSTIDMNGIARVGILLITIYALSALFSYLQTYIMATVTLKSSKQMRKDISEKINKVPQKYFNTVSQGDILSRVTNDVSTLQQTLSNSLPNIISAVAQFIGCLIMMFVTEWRLAICVVGITVIGVLMLVAIAGRSQRFFVKRQICVGEINGFVEEMYSGHDVVRLSRAEKNITKNFDQLNEDLYNANWKSQFLSGVMQPVMSAVGNMSYVAVCVIGAMLAMDNVISFGIIVSFIMYARLFSSPLTTIAQGMTNLQTATAASNRIFEFLEAEELEDESHKTAHIVDPKGNVTFDHVRFAYPTTPDKIIIKDFSATAKAGQKIAIVGPTGAGKSTLVNLLMRFFEVNSGSISIDGIPIQDMKREDVHALFSMVLQDTWLFDGTIRENLVYNMKNLTDADLDRVCKACTPTIVGIRTFFMVDPPIMLILSPYRMNVRQYNETIKRKNLDIPEFITASEAESMKILDALTAEEQELQVLYHQLTTAEKTDDYEEQVLATVQSAKRTSANLAKAHKKSISMGDELAARWHDLTKGKIENGFLPHPPTPVLI